MDGDGGVEDSALDSGRGLSRVCMAAMIRRLSTILTMVRMESEGRATHYLYSKALL
jgi:hypothetical protein